MQRFREQDTHKNNANNKRKMDTLDFIKINNFHFSVHQKIPLRRQKAKAQLGENI